MKKKMINKVNGFVLSTGRTGTVSITEILNIDQDTYSVHEPNPSIRFHFFSRFLFENKLSEDFIRNHYLKNRKSLFNRIDVKNYIEVNPFFWSAGHIFKNVKILHIVRDIESYIKSRLNFGAKGWHKHIIDYAPFYNIDVSKIDGYDIKNWKKLSKAEKETWRWILINEKIEQNKYNSSYLRIKFEDIYLGDEKTKTKVLKEIADFFLINLDIQECLSLLSKKNNPSKKRRIAKFSDLDQRIQNNIFTISENIRKRYQLI